MRRALDEPRTRRPQAPRRRRAHRRPRRQGRRRHRARIGPSDPRPGPARRERPAREQNEAPRSSPARHEGSGRRWPSGSPPPATPWRRWTSTPPPAPTSSSDPGRRRHRHCRGLRRRRRGGGGERRRRGYASSWAHRRSWSTTPASLRDNLLFRMTVQDWDDVMGVHLRGAFLMCRAVQSHMVAARFGRIVTMSSISALGNRGQANYSAAKAGLQGLTRRWRSSWAGSASPPTRSRRGSSRPT